MGRGGPVSRVTAVLWAHGHMGVWLARGATQREDGAKIRLNGWDHNFEKGGSLKSNPQMVLISGVEIRTGSSPRL